MPIAADDAELAAALAGSLGERLGAPRRVTVLARRPVTYESSFALEELDVELDGEIRLEMVVKDTSAAALSPQARRIRPTFVHDPAREACTYRDILAAAHLGTPCFHGAASTDGGSWLFVERVRGIPLREIGELDRWQDVAAWLGGMHGTLSPTARRLAAPCRLLRQDADLWREWMRRSLVFARRDSAADAHRRRGLEWLAQRHEPLVERLGSLTAGFLHGDFYASNILVEDARVCPVDWEMASLGPLALDLAALVSGSWGDEQRADLCRAYHQALGGQSFEELVDAVACCRLQLAIQWLGWGSGWEPPAEQRHDWLADAIALAQGLDL